MKAVVSAGSKEDIFNSQQLQAGVLLLILYSERQSYKLSKRLSHFPLARSAAEACRQRTPERAF